uniref:Uncharacterized protein n=1 Tax=Malurus cyaneus samueli TaxID=2593467 RepID=A0A8C5X7M2_9PASS
TGDRDRDSCSSPVHLALACQGSRGSTAALAIPFQPSPPSQLGIPSQYSINPCMCHLDKDLDGDSPSQQHRLGQTPPWGQQHSQLRAQPQSYSCPQSPQGGSCLLPPPWDRCGDTATPPWLAAQ